MHPLYPINDAPPCTPLPIVKRVSAVKPHGTRLLGIAKGGAFAPPRSRFCTPLATKTGRENLKIGHGKLDVDETMYSRTDLIYRALPHSAELVDIAVLLHIIPCHPLADLIFSLHIALVHHHTSTGLSPQPLFLCVRHVITSCLH